MKEVFEMVPPTSSSGATIMFGATALMLGLAILFGYLAFNVGKASFEISEAGLRLRGDLWGRLIPAHQLRVEEACVINLQEDLAHQLSIRTMGTALPGHQAGWFRLRNGEKSLVYLTDQTRVVYLPTRAGYSVMLSTPQPEAMLAALKRLSGVLTREETQGTTTIARHAGGRNGSQGNSDERPSDIAGA